MKTNKINWNENDFGRKISIKAPPFIGSDQLSRARDINKRDSSCKPALKGATKVRNIIGITCRAALEPFLTSTISNSNPRHV